MEGEGKREYFGLVVVIMNGKLSEWINWLFLVCVENNSDVWFIVLFFFFVEYIE